MHVHCTLEFNDNNSRGKISADHSINSMEILKFNVNFYLVCRGIFFF